MKRRKASFYHNLRPRWYARVGVRIFSAVVLLFLLTLALFVLLDMRHESRVVLELGASASQMAAVRARTLRLHVAHGSVTILLFGTGIFIIVRRLVTKRIEAIVLAVRHFRLGTWNARIPHATSDEIEWLAETFRQLGPHLEQTLRTFIEADRKATVARLGLLYEARVTPPARRTLTLSRSMVERERERWAWLEVEKAVTRILAEISLLGDPEQPALREITRVDPLPLCGNGPEDTKTTAGEGSVAPACNQSAIFLFHGEGPLHAISTGGSTFSITRNRGTRGIFDRHGRSEG